MLLSGSLALTSPPSVVHSLPGFQKCFPPREFQSLLRAALSASPRRCSRRPVLSGFAAACLSSSSAPYLPLSVWAFSAVSPLRFIGARFPHLLTPAADCCCRFSADYSTLSRFPPTGAFSDRRQLSRGKLIHFQCTTAASTLCALDGYGLRHLALARPALTPLMRFLFIGSHLCATLPSDLASRQMPLRFAILHLHQVECGTCTRIVVEHARHTLLDFAPLALRAGVFTQPLQRGG